jgi:predicted deacylase
MSNKDLVVGNLIAKTGEKKTGTVEFSVVGQAFSLEVFLINGQKEGPTVVITGGIHAAEYASVAAALEVGQKLTPENLSGRVIVVPVVNQRGFRVRSIYVNPMDGLNLNRVFPGKPDGSASEQIANWLFQNIIKQANYYIDLHGGDLVEALIPFTIFFKTGKPEVDKASIELARVFGIPYLVRSEGMGSTFAAAAMAGIPAILTEAGAQGIWKRDQVDLHVDGIHRVMHQYGMLPGAVPDPVESMVLDNFIWMRSDVEGFWYPAVEVGAKVSKGQNLGVIKDAWGKVLQDVVCQGDGDVLFLVSSLAINKGDPLLSYGA